MCHVYDSKYYKVFAIACCDMQYEDGVVQTLFLKILNYFMVDNGKPNVNFKGFMADRVQGD